MSTDPGQETGRVDAGGATSTRRRGGVVGVTVVTLLAGLLFGTSASLARDASVPSGAMDLVSLITARDEEVLALTERADVLRGTVEELQVLAANSQARQDAGRADALAAGVGLAPVEGPAVQVTLDDAGYSLSTLPQGYSVDDVVVHQQDLQGVVNALWAGGAEAIMVMDQRIVSTSSVQCVGNTLYLQGRVYSPPYTITAVGDPEAMHAALAADPVVSVYRQWADAIGLGYEVVDLPTAQLPGFAGSVRPSHARALDPEQVQQQPDPTITPAP